MAEEGGSLSQLARAAELSPSTASRLLSTLAAQELVRRDEHGHYHAGARLRALAAASLRQDPLHELAGPHLSALAAETGETANLAVAADDGRVVYLRQVASPSWSRPPAGRGARSPGVAPRSAPRCAATWAQAGGSPGPARSSPR